MALTEDGKFTADLRPNLTANIGVDLVEDQNRGAVDGGEHGLQGEHHAGGFATGRDLVERKEVLAGVRAEKEADGIGAMGSEFGDPDLDT